MGRGPGLAHDLDLHHVQRPSRVSAEALRIEAGTAGDSDRTDPDGPANAPATPIGRHAACYPSTSGSATISTSSMVTA